jgi:hypothetical protein
MNKTLTLSMFVFALCISPVFAMADSNALSERDRSDMAVDTTTTQTTVTTTDEASAPSATESGDIGEENASLTNTGNYPDGEPGSKDENPGIRNPADSETRNDSYPRGDIGAEYPADETTTVYEETTTVNGVVDDDANY